AGTRGEALARHREITLLTPPLIKQWAELAGQEELSALADNAGELRDWTEGRDLLDLVQRWPVPSLQPQQLVNLLRKLPPRLYSISSRDRKSTRLNSSHVKISYA